MQQTQTPPTIVNPFPGLRTFEAEEAHLFFGREAQTEELLKRLGEQRFVAVVGVSGSGKSSLVRAGLLPALHGGFLATARTWRQVCFRPGDRPIERLAESLAALSAFTPADLDPQLRPQWVETSLRRSGRGLVEATRLARLAPDENLLVVVDQFEELFRYHPEEASAFVKLLLEAVHQTDLPIYIVITMRSDYLGNCARFRDLPETLNDAQYLVPRMTRDQRRLAIEGPVLVGGGIVSAALLNRLLNDAGEDPDRLPLLQHALMRTWDHWASSTPQRPEIDLEDYEAVGGMAEALSRHANGAYEELGTFRPIAEIVFKRLTERDADHREVRRPATVGELQAVTAATSEDLEDVLSAFLRKGRSFLTRSPGDGPLTADVTIDISHESLIRSWTRLRTWAEQEAADGETYRRLASAALRHKNNVGAPLSNPDLDQALAWRAQTRPNTAWAERYGGAFDQTMRFLDISRDLDRKQKRWQTWRRRLIAVSAAAAIIFAVVFTTVVEEVNDRRRALATQYLTDAYATAERGDFLRAAHLFGLSAETAVDDGLRRVAMLNVWQYAGSILTSSPEAAIGGDASRPVRVSNAVTSNNGSTLTWSPDGQITLWREVDEQVTLASELHPDVQGAALSADGKEAASWSGDGRVRLWTAGDTLRPGPQIQHAGITGASFLGGLGLLTWSDDGKARLWSDPRAPRLIEHGGPARTVVSGDRWLVMWSDVVAASTPPPVGTSGQPEGSGASQAPAFNAVGQTQVNAWDLRGMAPPQRCQVQPKPSEPPWVPMKIVVGSGRVVAIGFSGTAVFCDLGSRTSVELNAGVNGSAIGDAIFDPGDPTGEMLLTWSPDGNVIVWRVRGASVLESRTLVHNNPVTGARFLGDGKIVAWDADAIHVWPSMRRDPGIGGQITFGRETSPIAGVKFTSDGDTRRDVAVVWRADGSAKLWDAASARMLADIPRAAPLESIDFGPNRHSVLLRDRGGRVRTVATDTGSPELDRSLPGVTGATLLGDHAVLAWFADGATKLLIAKPPETIALTQGRPLKDILPDATGRHALAIDETQRLALFVAGASTPVRFFAPYGATPLGGAAIDAAGSAFLLWPGAGYDPFAFEDSTATVSAARPLPEVRTVAGNNRTTIPAKDVSGGKLSPDGRFAVTWGTGGADLWVTSDGKSATGGARLSESSVDGAAFNRDSSLILVWGQKFEQGRSAPFARLWRTASPQSPVDLDIPGPVAGGTFDPGGGTLVVWSSAPAETDRGRPYACRVFKADGTISHNTCGGRMVGNAMFVSADQLLASQIDGSAWIWNRNAPDQDGKRLDQPGAIGGALILPIANRLILTWSADAWRLWNSSDGTRASPVVRQSHTILDAQFDEQRHILRTWDTTGTMRAWKLGADDDFPAGTVRQLLEALSGSRLDDQGNIVTLEAQDWSAAKSRMTQVLEAHRKEGCRHPTAADAMRERLRLAGPAGQ